VEDLHEQLGAGPPAGTVQVTLFVPSVDRDGNPPFRRDAASGATTLARESWYSTIPC
jgi:hypothetical protein